MSDQFSPVELVRSGPWTRALIGTYVLSLSFFEGIVLPALRQSGVRSIDILADVEGVAGALGEAGAREVGRTYALHPIRIPNHVFHPKFMILDGPDGPSAVVGSGNLTFGGWGYNLELCEILRPEHSGTALNGLADFLEELALADRLLGADAALLEPWVARLRGVPPSGGARIVHNVTRSISSQLVEQAAELGDASRLTVAAPYFGSSRAVDELARLLGSPAVDVHVHDGERLAVNGHHFPFSASGSAPSPVELDLLAPGAAGPLHAKLVEIECELGSLLMSGSVNGSLAALGDPQNVELGVVRVVDGTLPRTAASIPLKQRWEGVDESGAASFGILQATLLGTWLKGSVLSECEPGPWAAEFDHDGVVHNLGEIEVSADGRFEGGVLVPNASYGRRRSTLVLRRGDAQVRGFVAFPDAIELNNRWGAVIGPMIRVAGGSDDDDDLAGILEYFASNPGVTATAWRSAGNKSEKPEPTSRMISLSELEIHEAADDDHEFGGPSTRGAFDRILAALRVRWTTIPMRTKAKTMDHVEAEDGDEEEEDDVRVIGAFDALLDVLAERVPSDPAVELQRAADIAGFVLLRKPEVRRVIDFVAWWSNLAVRHLSAADLSQDIRGMAAALLLLDGLASSSPEMARGRLARVLGSVDEGLGLAEALGPGSRLSRLAEVMAGPTGLSSFAAQVRSASSAVEEVIIAARHVALGELPPALPLLDPTEEMRTIRRHLAAGHTSKILRAPRGTQACPDCRYALPGAQQHRFNSIGLARAANCCNRVMLVEVE
ncbi:hypothetical protein [Sphingobium sp. B2]|uniref:hypothetical protein n=1 Tax=Sphingobium sp. B2 TaxID=2583228 RepID=UPI00119E2EC3|nr:hypothetical protein [Sphingobium sp. B2]